MKTATYIASQQEKLLKKHPNLNHVQVVPLEATDLSLKQVSNFIEQCWYKDYADEARITFCPDSLEYNLNNGPSLTLWDANNELNGLLLAYKVNFEKNSQVLCGCLCTGLSTHPDCTGQGIAQMLYLRQLEIILAKKLDFSLYWFDSNHSDSGNSYHIFGKNRGIMEFQSRIKIFGKSLDCEIADQAVGGLSRVEKIGIKLTNVLFKPQKAVFKQYKCTVYKKGEYTQYSLPIKQNNAAAQRVFSKQEFDFKSDYTGNEIQARCFILHNEQKEVLALMRGYTNPVSHGRQYFQVDHLFFDSKLSWQEKKKFTGHCEDAIHRTVGCFGIIIPANVSTDTLFKFGYIPVDEQVLAMNCFSEKAHVLAPEIDHLEVELR